jgi:hypothetical protein
MSIIVVQITRRNTYTVQRRRERTRKKKDGCCCCCFFQYIDRTIYIYSQISSNACTSHTFCLFFSLSLSFSFAVIYALSLLLVVGIHRQGVMTRKERGEDVYGCIFGQTLNDERSQSSNPINYTK